MEIPLTGLGTNLKQGRIEMKTFGLTMGTIVIAGSLVLSTDFKANAAGRAKDQITEIENKMIAATSADELMKYYDGRDVTVYDVAPPLQFKGTSAVHGDFTDFYSAAKDLKGEFVELVVVADGDMGMARSIQHFTWKDRDGKPTAMTIRQTDVFHKVKGEWKVMHSHISVPVDLKTNQGQLNLKP
jgi:ketosteroid isomerase-like protein